MSGGLRLLMLGRQGAGKGTQAVRVSEHYGVPHISTGDIFRAPATSSSEAGRRAAEYMTRGELVPDEVVIKVVVDRLGQRDTAPGFILDGFPRTRHQAEALKRMLGSRVLDAAVDIDVPTEIVLYRLTGRRVCRTCGSIYHVDAPPVYDWVCDRDGGPVVQRADDKLEAISRRLELYERETGPLLDFYDGQGKLVRVDGVGEPDAVFARVLAALDDARRPSSSRQAAG